MSKIFDLINELCPNGVEFRELGEICELERGNTITSKDINDGDIPVISGGQRPAYYHNEYNRDGETITIAGSGAYAGFIMYWNRPIFVADAFSIKSQENRVIIKFVYHFLLSKQEKIYNMKQGAGIPHVYAKDVSKIKLPVPPMEVQREIVRILDCFTLLTAELTAELTARKKQYEFYRDRLLSFDELNKNGGGCELKMLSEVISNVSNIKWSNDDKIYKYIDLTSVDMQNHQIGNLSDISKDDHPSRAQQIVKFNDIIFATTRPMQKRITLIPEYLDGQICSTGYCVLRINEKIALPSWVYYILCTSKFYEYVDKFQQGASYPSISDIAVKKFQIPIPSLAIQRKIVEILDKFDTLVNSIAEGLPCEIKLRQKQYEYYRERLLSFTEIKKEI